MALLLTVTEPQEALPGLQNTMVFGPAGGCIGRGQDNDWVLPDPMRYLSVHHARVRCYQGTYYIEDTSTNGVFLNGAPRPLGKTASPPLRHGDRLKMGGYELRVSISDSSEAANDPVDFEPAALSGDGVEALLIDHSNVLPALAEPPPAPLPVDLEPLPLDNPVADRRRAPRAGARCHAGARRILPRSRHSRLGAAGRRSARRPATRGSDAARGAGGRARIVQVAPGDPALGRTEPRHRGSRAAPPCSATRSRSC